MKPIFTPEDFKLPFVPGVLPGVGKRDATAQESSDIANAKLHKLMKTWPVVTGFKEGGAYCYGSTASKLDTHTARLAFIEELPKKKCEHEPRKSYGNEPNGWICDLCGVELVAKWEER